MRALVIIVLLATAVLPAQERAYLVALDRQGQSIDDLKSGEFELLDNGHAQPIASLARLEKASPSPIVFFYDLLNTGIYARATVQQQIVQALQNLPPNVPSYLYLLNGDAQLVPIHGVNAAETPKWPNEAGALLDGALRNTSVVRPNNLSPVGARVNATYAALIRVANEIANLDGRKNLVWITHGVPTYGVSTDDTPVEYLPILQKVAAGLAHEELVIYPVQQTAGALPGATDTSPEMLRTVAAITGGRVFLTETIDKAAAEVLRDAASSYVLTFAAKPDGKFHSLRINCKRPGVRIQARSGYFAK